MATLSNHEVAATGARPSAFSNLGAITALNAIFPCPQSSPPPA